MAQVTVTKAISGYFNVGNEPSPVNGKTGKRAPSDFLAELKALSTEEKRELAEGVVAITGDTLVDAK